MSKVTSETKTAVAGLKMAIDRGQITASEFSYGLHTVTMNDGRQLAMTSPQAVGFSMALIATQVRIPDFGSM